MALSWECVFVIDVRLRRPLSARRWLASCGWWRWCIGSAGRWCVDILSCRSVGRIGIDHRGVTELQRADDRSDVAIGMDGRDDRVPGASPSKPSICRVRVVRTSYRRMSVSSDCQLLVMKNAGRSSPQRYARTSTAPKRRRKAAPTSTYTSQHMPHSPCCNCDARVIGPRLVPCRNATLMELPSRVSRK